MGLVSGGSGGGGGRTAEGFGVFLLRREVVSLYHRARQYDESDENVGGRGD